MSSSSSNDPIEIPGFYYDPEKNRYFRVLPGTNNHNPLTSNQIVTKKARLDKCTRREKNIFRNAVDLLHQRSTGVRHVRRKRINFQMDMTEVKLRNCSKKIDLSLTPHPVSSIQQTMDYSDDMLYHWRKGDRMDFCVIGHKHVHALPHCSSVCLLNFDQKGVLGACAGHSEMFWWDYGKPYYCKKVVTGRTPFSCASALNPNSKYVASFGDGNKAVFITNLEPFFSSAAFHVRGGPGYSVVRLKRDILAQSFSYDANIHFNGLRGGTIIGLDRRMQQKGSYFCSISPNLGTNSASPNVCQMRALSDEFSLIVGYQNTTETPLMFLWDVRFHSKPVLEYSASTVYRCSEKLPKADFTINVDKDEQVITSVLPGCDYRLRIWSIKTGQIITEYPDEHISNTDYVTAASYTKDWYGIEIAVHGQGIKFLSFQS